MSEKLEFRKCICCGALFMSYTLNACENCEKEALRLYPEIRDYLRNNEDTKYNEETLAKILNINPGILHILVESGYIEKNIPKNAGYEAMKKRIISTFSNKTPVVLDMREKKKDQGKEEIKSGRQKEIQSILIKENKKYSMHAQQKYGKKKDEK